MIKNQALIVLLAALVLPLSAPAALPQAVAGKPLPSLAPMLDQATPAVVNIATRGRVQAQENPLLNDPFFRRFFDLPAQPRERRTQSLGSGVVVDAAEGYVLTNHHVIDKAEEITVTLRDGRNLNAELIGSDPETDVAVIQVPAEGLSALPWADSDGLRVGDFVVAIGNPFGLGQTVTSGIVSALGRSGLGIEGYEDFIQTDASINPGNSGGALVNLRGQLVGINTAILAPSGGNVGIGFAIPTNMARDIMEQLIEFGTVRRGRLGVAMQDLTPELAAAFDLEQHRGAIVAQVEPGSAADQAGLRAGDVVVAVNGRPVRGAGEIRNLVGLVRVGSRLEMEVIREGKRQRLTATIAAPKVTELRGEELHPALEGSLLASQQGESGGVLVKAVARAGAAHRAGLRPGDRIIGLNRQPVSELRTLRQRMRAGGRMLLTVQRGQQVFFLVVN